MEQEGLATTGLMTNFGTVYMMLVACMDTVTVLGRGDIHQYFK